MEEIIEHYKDVAEVLLGTAGVLVLTAVMSDAVREIVLNFLAAVMFKQ
jgi:hypothetical protein